MFGGKKQDAGEVVTLKTDLEASRKDYKLLKEYNERERRELEGKHQRELENLQHNHKLALQTKEFEMKHFKDNELKKALEEKTKLEQRVAVLEAENKMLNKITDLNGDIIDVKELVKNLIGKLPTVNLNGGLTVNTDGKSK